MRSFALFPFILVSQLSQAAQPEVTSVTVQQRPAPSGLVDIHYDAFDTDGDELQISLQISDDSGVTWAVPVITVYGDIGSGITSGNRFIVWDAGLDYPDIAISTMKARIIADDGHSALEMTLIPAGTFTMGQNGTNGVPEHQVTLTRDFYMGTFEVTNGEYREALQWAHDAGYVTASSSTVQAHGFELLDLDDENCELTFNDGLFGLRESPSDYAQNAYPSGYDPVDHPIKEVCWYGAASYCDWRSITGGLSPILRR